MDKPTLEQLATKIAEEATPELINRADRLASLDLTQAPAALEATRALTYTGVGFLALVGFRVIYNENIGVAGYVSVASGVKADGLNTRLAYETDRIHDIKRRRNAWDHYPYEQEAHARLLGKEIQDLNLVRSSLLSYLVEKAKLITTTVDKTE